MGLGGWLGEVFGNVDDAIINPFVSNVLPGVEDTGRNEGGFMDDLAHLDFDGMHERENTWEDNGNQMFGTGGWYKEVASRWLGPYANALAENIENKGDAEQSWTKAVGSTAGNYAAKYAGSYMSEGTSDYSIAGGDTTYKNYGGDSTTSGVSGAGDYSLSGSNAGLGNNTGTAGYGGASTAGDYSLASGGTTSTGTNGTGYGFQGNTYQAPGNDLQNQWANYKVENPTTAAAAEGAVKGGIKAFVSGDDPFKGALYGGASNAASTAFSDYTKEKEKGMEFDNAYSNPSFDFSTMSPMDSFGNYSQNTPTIKSYGDSSDWMSQLKDNPWLQTTLGIAGGLHPALGALGKAIYGTGDNRASNPMYNIGATLGQLYSNNRAQQALKGQLGQFDANRGAYQTQLQSDLSRRDAASGRRSQYGPRSVELQARMAALDAQRAPSLMKMYDAQNTLRNQNVSNVLNSAWTNRDAIKSGYNSLSDYFTGGE